MRISIERTFDASPIQYVLSDPVLFDLFRVSVPAKNLDFSMIVRDERNFCFVARDEEGIAGIVRFDSSGGDKYEAHIAFLSRVWGKGVAQAAARAALATMFDDIGAGTITTTIPRRRDLMPVMRLARQVGMQSVGMIEGDGVPEYLFVMTPSSFRR